MAVDPQVGALDQIGPARDEAGRREIVRIAGVEAAQVRRMVGDHHGRAVERRFQLGGQPCRLGPVPRQGIGRREAPQAAFTIIAVCFHRDQPMVEHHLGAGLHRVVDALAAEQRVVGPPGRAEHADRRLARQFEHRHAGGQQMHLRMRGRGGGQLRIDPREGAVVVLVVTGHIDDRPAQMTGRPVDAVAAVGDVAGQHDHVGIAVGDRLGGMVFQMQIAQNA